MKINKFLTSRCYALTGMMYIIITLNVLINPQNPNFAAQSSYLSVLTAAAVFGLLLMAFVMQKIKYKKSLVFLCMAVLIVLQAVVIENLSVNYNVESWDMGVVYNAAKYYVDNGSFDMGKYDYFLWFPNNSPLYTFFIILFKAFAALGIENTGFALNVFNSFLLFTSAFFTERSVTVLLGKEYSAIGMALCILLCPFSLYAVLAYTDTFSMVFLAVAIYFYICAVKEKGNYYINLILFAVFTAVGASLKVSVLILAIAALIDICIRHRQVKKTVISLLLVGAIGFGGFISMKYAHEHSPFLPEYDYDYTIPYTHWVMMGLNGLGGYNDDDYQQITLQYPDKASRQQANIQEIIRRIEEKGPGGMVKHFANKLSYIYADGTFGACYKLDWSVVKGTELHNYVLYLGSKFYYLGYFSMAMLISILAIIAAGMFVSLKKADKSAVMPALCLIGVTLFILMWEARTRYILNFLPIFVLMAVFGIKQLFSALKKD